MAPMMASPLRSKSLDAVPLATSKKRARSLEDEGDEAPRVDKKVGVVRTIPHKHTDHHHPYQLRPLPFRTSPTSQHGKGFSQPHKPRPTSLFSPLAFPTAASHKEVKRQSCPLQTPPRTKSSDKSSFSDAFSIFRETVDSDTDMPDSPMDVSAPSTSWTTPQTSPEDYEAPLIAPFATGAAMTPPSPISSRSTTPNKPKPSRFELRSPTLPVIGQRLPTPTYGHFPALSSRKVLDDGADLSPRTCSNSVKLRRGLPSLVPPSPIRENEFESPTAAYMGDLFTRMQMSSPPKGGSKNTSSSDSPSRAKLGRRMAVDHSMDIDEPQRKSGKTTLVMGYRADCEKCRNKVPGHFNHIVPRS